MVETRRRLRGEFAHLPQSDVKSLARQGKRDELLEDVRHIVFAHSGDAMPIEPDEVRGADLLVHDATFLNDTDRREPIHATSEEAFEVARVSQVKSLLLHHLSIRYERSSVIAILRRQLAHSGFEGECWWLDEGTFVNLRQ